MPPPDYFSQIDGLDECPRSENFSFHGVLVNEDRDIALELRDPNDGGGDRTGSRGFLLRHLAEVVPNLRCGPFSDSDDGEHDVMTHTCPLSLRSQVVDRSFEERDRPLRIKAGGVEDVHDGVDSDESLGEPFARDDVDPVLRPSRNHLNALGLQVVGKGGPHTAAPTGDESLHFLTPFRGTGRCPQQHDNVEGQRA